MKILFMGTPEFAVPSLDMLVQQGYDIVGVVTQPDKPKGRGNKLTPPPVKEYALGKGIPVLQPEKVKTPEFAAQIKALQPDLMVTAAYGKILPKEVLDIPPMGCINVHGSLLPKYRGSAPLWWVVIHGETVTGITTMFTDVGMDTGDMLLKKELPITEDMTTEDVHDAMALLGAEVLQETLEQLQAGTLVRIPQNHEEATYAPMIKKEMAHIDWTRPAQEIHNLIRGMNPWPIAYTHYKDEVVKVWKAQPVHGSTRVQIPGTICEVGKEGIVVAAGSGCIRIVELQFSSSKRMTVEQYLAGHAIEKGEVLK